jgi:hypothetical protein
MRTSWPMPSATTSTSAPTRSQIRATWLMNEMRVARNAFEACLISSAVGTSVSTTGQPSSATTVA